MSCTCGFSIRSLEAIVFECERITISHSVAAMYDSGDSTEFSYRAAGILADGKTKKVWVGLVFGAGNNPYNYVPKTTVLATAM